VIFVACLASAGVAFLIGEAFGRFAHRERTLRLLKAMDPLDCQFVMARLDDAARKLDRGQS
jgi:hypothetical protein